MCGRYTLTSPKGIVEELEVASGEPAIASEWWRPRFNIAPTQPAPVVIDKDGARVLEMMRWGLVPHWADSLAIGARMINARVETLASKPAFRDAIQRRRCLVPADGFFEWRLRGAGRSTKRIPIYMRPVPQHLVAFAGLWERWKAPDGVWVTSFTIVTGPPNELAARFHDRMPVILAPEHYATWLAPEPLPAEVLERVLAVPAVGDWQAAEVSMRANSPANDDPEVIEVVEERPGEEEEPEQAKAKAKAEAEAEGKPKQMKLFE
jgi:putative SOS response-associated peptidase YedK